MLPTASLNTPWSLEDSDGVQVLRLRAPKTKDEIPGLYAQCWLAGRGRVVEVSTPDSSDKHYK